MTHSTFFGGTQNNNYMLKNYYNESQWGQKQHLTHFSFIVLYGQKTITMCSTEESNAYKFEMTR